MIAINISTFPAAGGTYTIVLTKSDYLFLWTSVIVGSGDWFTVLNSEQTGAQTWEIEVDVDANSTPLTRTMTINAETEVEQQNFEIVQAAASIPQPSGSIVSVTPSGDIPASGGSLTIDVKVTNGDDDLTIGQIITGSGYCTLTSITHGVTSGADTVTRFVYAVAQNANLTSRGLSFRFTVSNGYETDVVSLSKNQLGAPPTMPVPSITSVTPSGPVAASGENLTIDVKVTNGTDSLTQAAIITGGSFVSLTSTTHGVTSGSDIVTRFVFAVAANSGSSRNFELSFIVSDGVHTANANITKTQAAAVVPGELYGEIKSESPSGNISATGGNLTYDVEVTNGDDDLTTASVESGGTFASVQSITHGVTSGDIIITRIVIAFAANTAFESRTASFNVIVSDGENTYTIPVSKTQDAADPVYPSGQIRNVSPEGNVGASGGALIYDVRVVNGTDALTTATVTPGDSFVRLVNVQHGILSGGYIISRFAFFVNENQSASDRNIVIRFNFSDGTLAGHLDVTNVQNAAISERIILEPNYSVLPWYTSKKYQNARKWWLYGKIYPLFTPAGKMLPFQIIRAHRTSTTISLFRVYTSKDVLIGDFTQEINDAGITVKQFPEAGYDVIVFPSLFPVFDQMDNGQYYAVLADGTETWYSEIFTVVNDIEPYLKIEWWDKEDFVTDGGIVVYTEPTFHNLLYLESDIAKPEYVFEEEGENRDGYFFPSKQISEKKYRFSFLSSEYLLDVIRLIRMADYVRISYNGKTYTADSFLITPEWEDNGDVAVVDAEFETATVAKKLGLGYLRAKGGDFNNDFNEDFNNS